MWVVRRLHRPSHSNSESLASFSAGILLGDEAMQLHSAKAVLFLENVKFYARQTLGFHSEGLANHISAPKYYAFDALGLPFTSADSSLDQSHWFWIDCSFYPLVFRSLVYSDIVTAPNAMQATRFACSMSVASVTTKARNSWELLLWAGMLCPAWQLAGGHAWEQRFLERGKPHSGIEGNTSHFRVSFCLAGEATFWRLYLRAEKLYLLVIMIMFQGTTWLL